METYHKIKTVYERDPETNYRTLIEGRFATPEFAYLANAEWEFTEKVDGTNIRLIFNHETATVDICGKSDKSDMPPFLYDALRPIAARIERWADFTSHPACSACLYGEGYGAKIQKGGGNYRPDPGFVLFDVWWDGIWQSRFNVEDIAEQLELDVAPVIDSGNLHRMIDSARYGFDSRWGSFRAEGIVARPKKELLDVHSHRIITKIKCGDFAHG